MALTAGALVLHGLVEVIAGARMLLTPEEVFPQLGAGGPAALFMGRAFGMGIFALGITAFASLVSGSTAKRGASLAAMCYNLLIAVVFFHQAQACILMHTSKEATTVFAVYHAVVAALQLAGALWPARLLVADYSKAKRE
mmetsp:Transcript_11174/g.45483  ORF Transcript_11174/g.45483 Transcript_11174/m.45483 type:complete len:140 (+) Transcript_11174:46-465(+)|eukprot:CAMPEP_0114626886 /NCGR_PEP_ID=MMETSP0168-20121206/12013_1 /TAXON_ID=95228 ORGANISM="Vannella sp., Strain DIVA3 517/6/12" /NCGR_SAMPLE_ID=MMETSP0168 /ASSEMBLY_ACC=CAM_ASM_000044 /LENGTH=139 /DNA_ID=CAMNT_0001838205 /DNA_START=49 /DNA_END=468 /DNA_ORIENTATION=+